METPFGPSPNSCHARALVVIATIAVLAGSSWGRLAAAQGSTVEIVSSEPMFLVDVLISEAGTVVVLSLRGPISAQRLFASKISPGSSAVDGERYLTSFYGWAGVPPTAVARTGGKTFVWAWPRCTNIGLIKVRRFDFDLGALAPSRNVRGLQREICKEATLDVAGSPDGHVAVAWVTRIPSANSAVIVRRSLPDEDAEATDIIASAENIATYGSPVIVLDPAHGVTVAWERRERDTRHVWARSFSAESTSAAPSQTRSLAPFAESPDVAGVGDGRHVISWVVRRAGTAPQTFIQAFNPDGSSAGQPIVSLTDPQQAMYASAIAMSEQGGYLVTGLVKGGAGSNPVLAAFQFPSQRVGAPLLLSSSNSAVRGPKVAINYHGTKWVVAWPETRANGIAIVIARGAFPTN